MSTCPGITARANLTYHNDEVARLLLWGVPSLTRRHASLSFNVHRPSRLTKLVSLLISSYHIGLLLVVITFAIIQNPIHTVEDLRVQSGVRRVYSWAKILEYRTQSDLFFPSAFSCTRSNDAK